jgi:HEAT repeat protein
MKYLAIMIALTFFLFVPNSVAFNKDRRDKRLPKLYEILDKEDARQKQVALQMIRIADDPKYHKYKFFGPILELLNDKNPKVREAATAKFKRMAGGYKSSFYKSEIAKGAIVPALIQALSDKSASVRLEAAKALGYYQDLRAVDPLISVLQDQELWIRFEAIHALGKIKAGAEAVIPLLNVIAVDDVWPTKLIQQEAMKTLALILNQGAVTVRQKKVKDKYYKNGITVRKTLIDPRIRGKVISILLKKNDDSYLKASVIKILDSMHIQLREDHSESVLKHLIASAGDNNAQIRKLALSSLFSIVYLCVQDVDKTDRNMTVHRYRSIVTDLCIAALKDPSVAVRKKAADLLGKSEDYKAVGPLIAALNDNNPDMQVAVITALANFSDPKMIDPLLDTLSDESEVVRISAIDVLGDYDDLKVVRALPPHFESFKKGDDNAIVRRVFLEVVKATKEEIRIVYHYNGKRYVRKIDDTTSAVLPRNLDINGIKTLLYHPTAVESILVALGDSKFKGHVTALKTLQRFEDERISQHIMPYIDNPSPAVRKAVLPLVFLSCDTEQAMLILQKTINDKDIRVQKEARKLLKALETALVKDDESLKLNIDALKNRDSATRLAAVKALTRLNDNEAVDPLINCLNDADGKVRLYAVKALRQLKDKRAVMPLIQRLDDSDLQVRRAAVDALKRLGDTRAVEPLLELTDDRHIRVYVVRALPWFDDPRVTDFFLELLQNPNGEMQLEAVKYFSRNPDQRAVKFLIPLLQSANKDMPSWAAGALGASRDKRAVKPLIKLLTRKPPVRNKEKKNIYRYKRSAVLALGKIGDKRAYPLLVDALKDEELKGFAILALGHLQDKRATPILATYLSDPSPHIRSFAIRSLGQIGDFSLFDTLVPFLSDPNEMIVKSTVHAVIRLDPERAQEILIEMIDTQDPATLERTLRLIGCSEARIVLSKLIKIAAARKGFNAVMGKQLSKCNNPEIAAILISHLKEEKNRDLRVTVIDILGEFDDPNVKGLLANYSNDPDPVLRRHASNALGEFKDVLIATLIEDEGSFGVRYTKGRHKLKSGYTDRLWSPERGTAPIGGGYKRISGSMALQKDPRVAKLISEYTFDGYTCVHLEFENPTEIGTLIRQLNDTDPVTQQKAAD